MSEPLQRLRSALADRYVLEREIGLRLWDKADPELQARVAEAREALRRLTAEPRQ